jgi:hypothetical protein
VFSQMFISGRNQQAELIQQFPFDDAVKKRVEMFTASIHSVRTFIRKLIF